MRLFAAVLPPARAVGELATAVDLRVRGLPGASELRWTEQAGWHFTLAFMGEVDDALVPELRRRLAEAARRTEAFSLRLRGGGHFGGRALWAGAAEGVAELRRLAERADAAARRSGLPMEEHRAYRPHLTLARTRTETDLAPYATALDGFEGTPWEVGELALVRSRLPLAGLRGEQPRYETLVRCPTARPAARGR